MTVDHAALVAIIRQRLIDGEPITDDADPERFGLTAEELQQPFVDAVREVVDSWCALMRHQGTMH